MMKGFGSLRPSTVVARVGMTIWVREAVAVQAGGQFQRDVDLPVGGAALGLAGKYGAPLPRFQVSKQIGFPASTVAAIVAGAAPFSHPPQFPPPAPLNHECAT